MIQYDWAQILAKARAAFVRGCEPNFTALSEELNVPRTTLRDGFQREFGVDTVELVDFLQLRDIPNSVEQDNGDRIGIREDENEMTVDVQSRRIKTLDDVIIECHIDLNTWEIERWVVNKWEVGAKTSKKSLTWQDGTIVKGEIEDHGAITVEPLFQVKVWLKRKAINALHPISIQITPQTPEFHQTTSRNKKALIVPDIQFGYMKNVDTGRLIPYHDRSALSIVLQVARQEKFDRIIFLGDLLDLPEMSDRFIQMPDFYWTTQTSLIEAAWWLGQFRASNPDAEIDLIEGNHDFRLKTKLINNAPAAHNLRTTSEIDGYPALSIPHLLGLREAGIGYIEDYPEGEVWLNDFVRCVHGQVARGSTGDTARTIIKTTNVTTIFGHIHKIELVSKTIYDRAGSRPVHAFSPGCLCKIDGSVPGSNRENQWQQGAAIVYYSDDRPEHTIQPIPIHNGIGIFRETILEADDHLPAIAQDTSWSAFLY